eukprot:1467628-Pyramimonas_sp.AAC.1
MRRGERSRGPLRSKSKCYGNVEKGRGPLEAPLSCVLPQPRLPPTALIKTLAVDKSGVGDQGCGEDMAVKRLHGSRCCPP